MRFDGPDYVPSLDRERLSKQYERVFDAMKDGGFRSLAQIEDATGDPPASISAQLRHMRKQRFGSHVVNKRRRGTERHGLWEYQLCVNKTADMVTA